MKHLASKVESAKFAISKSTQPIAVIEPVRHNLARSERLYQFIRAAHGVHNVYLASLIMREADRNLNDVGRTLIVELPDIFSEPMISGSFCATQCHKEIGVKVPPETVRVSGKIMPHRTHTEMMDCVKCHNIGGHKQVPLKRNYKETCKECHKE